MRLLMKGDKLELPRVKKKSKYFKLIIYLFFVELWLSGWIIKKKKKVWAQPYVLSRFRYERDLFG